MSSEYLHDTRSLLISFINREFVIEIKRNIRWWMVEVTRMKCCVGVCLMNSGLRQYVPNAGGGHHVHDAISIRE